MCWFQTTRTSTKQEFSMEKLAVCCFQGFKQVNSQSHANRRFPSCISSLFQSKSMREAFHMEISFIHTQISVHLHVNQTNFHMKGFALGLALKQRRKATWKLPIQIHSGPQCMTEMRVSIPSNFDKLSIYTYSSTTYGIAWSLTALFSCSVT